MRIDDRRAGRELLRRLIPSPLRGRLARPRPGGLGRPWDSASRASRRWACRTESWPASRPSSSRAWPRGRPSSATPARARPSTGSSRSGARTSTSWSPRWPRTTRAWRRRSPAARDALRDVPGVAPIWDAGHATCCRPSGAVRVQGRHQPAGHRGQRHPRHQPARGHRSRPASSSWATRTRTATCRRCPQPEVLGRNGTYVVFRKLQTRVAAFRQYVRARAKSRAEEELLAAKFVGRWPSGAPLALAAGRATTRSWAPIPRGTTPSSTPRRRRSRPQVPARRPRPADEPARRGDHRPGADAPDDPARAPATARSLPEGVLEDDGADRGILFFCLQAQPGPAVRVRQDAVDQRRQLHRRARREGPAGRGRTTRAASSPSPSSRSAAASRGCPSSSSTAAASTASCPACGRCAGSPSSTPELKEVCHGRPLLRPAGPRRPRVRHHRRVRLSQPRAAQVTWCSSWTCSRPPPPPRCSPTRSATASASGR